MNTYVVIIYGPPGAGKTTTAFQLVDCIVQKKQDVMLLSGDSIESYLCKYGKIPSFQKVTYNSLEFVKANTLNKKEFLRQNWKQSRDLMKEFLKTIINSSKKYDKKTNWIIIQDDMLLRSVRKQYQQILNDQQAYYLQVCLTTSLEQCLKNNKKRVEQEQVPQDILKSSFWKFQPPKQQTYTYQHRYQNKLSLKEILPKFKQIKINDNYSEKLIEHEKLPQHENEIFEIKARKHISKIMKGETQIQTKLTKKQLANQLNKLKKQYKGERKPQSFINYIFLNLDKK